MRWHTKSVKPIHEDGITEDVTIEAAGGNIATGSDVKTRWAADMNGNSFTKEKEMNTRA